MADCKSWIRQVPLELNAYVPVIAPCACNYFAIVDCGPDAVMRSSDPTNPEAEYQMSAHAGYALIGPSLYFRRFEPGEIVTWLKSLGGVGPAVVEFTL
jgi:hypothetical protein